MTSETKASAETGGTSGRFPGGMVVLLVYLWSGVVGALVALTEPKPFVLGPYEFPQWAMLVFMGAETLALGCAGYGILRRRRWGKTLAVTWLLVQVVVQLVNAGLGLTHPREMLRLTSEALRREPLELLGHKVDPSTMNGEGGMAGIRFALIQGAVLITGLNTIAIVYLRRQREFFRA